jgi:OOP family OmpA-OmpF porin
MKTKHILRFLGILILGVFVISFISTSPQAADAFTCTGDDLNPKVKNGELNKKVDNFLVLLDASSTMADKTKSDGKNEQRKLPLAKNLIQCMNETIPFIFMNAGMRAFGPYHSEKGLIYGMISYSKAGLNDAVLSVDSTGGTTLIARTILDARKDLQGTTGKTAIILFSDGINSITGDPIAEAAGLKKQFGKDMCIYTILLGNDPEGKKYMDGIAKAGECGFATDADTLLTDNGMTDFVTNVFLTKTEGKEDVSITLLVEFDFDKDYVKPYYHSDILEVANFLKAYPETNIVLEGHTDSQGNSEYNLNLSRKRAESIKKYLVDKFGISVSRISTKGLGMSQPVATNSTKEGRKQNRRVEAHIMTFKTK